ncbi:MAG: glycine/sarcosine/betaine reductase selenoprotein B family protein [Acidobacteriota bacterium]
MEIIEDRPQWEKQFAGWKQRAGTVANDVNDSYPFVKNARAPFTPAHRSLSMINLALISSAGGYIDGTDPFDASAPEGDFTFREIPSEIDPGDLRFSARGYDPALVQQDVNVQVPLARLSEFESNRIIGQLNSTFWSFCGFIPNAGRLVTEMLPKLIERLQRYEVQAALLIPASRLCHQSMALAARAIEQASIPTMMLAVERDITEDVRPPRAGFYKGQIGSVTGQPNWPEHQRRVLDEALRWIEPMGQPGMKKLVVELESQVEAARGER